jgi:hypothetical protein
VFDAYFPNLHLTHAYYAGTNNLRSLLIPKPPDSLIPKPTEALGGLSAFKLPGDLLAAALGEKVDTVVGAKRESGVQALTVRSCCFAPRCIFFLSKPRMISFS